MKGLLLIALIVGVAAIFVMSKRKAKFEFEVEVGNEDQSEPAVEAPAAER